MKLKPLPTRLIARRADIRALALVALFAALVTLVSGAMTGCQQSEQDDPGDRSGADGTASLPALAENSPVAATDREAAASHILIMYTGSRGAGPQITRSRSEADDAARRVHLLLRTDRASFEELARKYSDDEHTRDRDGYIGIFQRGEMTLAFDRVVFGLEVGQISGVLETEYGFHVIRREPVRWYHIHHLLIAWHDARKNPSRATRSHQQAKKLAEKIRQQAVEDKTDFCQLARKYSDDPGNRAACGDLGWIEPGTLSPDIEAVIFKLQPGAVSEVVESPYGFHLFWRQPG